MASNSVTSGEESAPQIACLTRDPKDLPNAGHAGGKDVVE